jgi:DNA-binding transcriptional LysR family regulator
MGDTMQWADRIGRRVKLQDVHILLATVESGSMAKAAERLAISQPVISRSIASLEHALGVRLLERGRNGIEPTMYGRALVTHGLAAFDDLKQGVKAIETLADPTVGEVRVGCPEPISGGLLTEVIDRFCTRHPRAVVTVVAANDMSPDFRPLRERKVDFLLGRVGTPFADDDLDAEILYQDQLYIVAGRHSRWARRRRLALADLVDAPWLWTPTMFSWRIAETFEANGLAPPKVSVQTHSIHQRVALLATNRFVGMLSGSLLRFNADRLSLKILPIKFSTRPWSVAIVKLKDRMVSPIVQAFIEGVREVAKPLTNSK